jgi:hypothetical protein
MAKFNLLVLFLALLATHDFAQAVDPNGDNNAISEADLNVLHVSWSTRLRFKWRDINEW